MRKRYLGLLALPMALAECQPACTPEPGPTETPVEVTVAAPVETMAPATTPPPATTQPPATTAAPNLNPLNIRFSGIACDESPTMSGWTSFLAVEVRHDGAWDVPVEVTLEDWDGSTYTRSLADLNPGEFFGYGYAYWPRRSNVYDGIGTGPFHQFQPSARFRVAYQGNVVLDRTFTLDEAKAMEPYCAPVIDTPGVYDPLPPPV